ncbi:hypothetical protein OLQ26_06520 [Campylobacter jejuni]|nr:hypothetical protein [Campylobacter jejuni]
MMICALASSMADFISSSEYFPEPKINLESNSYLPIFNLSFLNFLAFLLLIC